MKIFILSFVLASCGYNNCCVDNDEPVTSDVPGDLVCHEDYLGRWERTGKNENRVFVHFKIDGQKVMCPGSYEYYYDDEQQQYQYVG